MCGIAGEIRFSGDRAGADVEAVARITAAMHRRGPDGSGVHAAGAIALGHRRLKIIDLSERGAQPMVDPELGLAAVFNGCIYNYRELRAELQAAGYRFFSDSDSEVLLKSFHRWGAGCVDHFLGMFAFAVADRDTGVLTLGRDRLGIKPLYLDERPGMLRFSSSLPALLEGGGVDTDLDPVALHHYMTFHSVVPAPRTILAGVRKLPPATVRTIQPDGTSSEHVYWRPEHVRRPQDAGMTAKDWDDAVLEALRLAVRRRMVADVPVGVLLSGGLDSSLVVALLAEEGQRGLKTFSVGFHAAAGESGDEFVYSDLVARHFGTDHRQILVDPDRMLPAVDHTIAAMAEPMVSHDCVAFHLLSEEVAKSVTVVQSGQGADEVFAGYNWYPPLARVPRERAVEAYSDVFTDRPHAELAADPGARVAPRPRPQPRVRRRAVRAAGRRHDARRRAAAGLHRHAGGRPGQARRQHDDGLGPGGPRPVPGPRAGGARRRLPAGAQARARREGRAQAARPAAWCPTASSTGRRGTSPCRRSVISRARSWIGCATP